MIKAAQWFQLRTIPCDDSKHLSSLKICLLLFFLAVVFLNILTLKSQQLKSLSWNIYIISFLWDIFPVGKRNSTPEISHFVSSRGRNTQFENIFRVGFATTNKKLWGDRRGKLRKKSCFYVDVHNWHSFFHH